MNLTTGAALSLAKVYVYGETNWRDKLTSFDGKAVISDAVGNVLSYSGYSYTWEEGRQLASISGNGKTITFKYNDNGIRTEKTVNGVLTKYRLIGNRVSYEYNGTDFAYYTYDSNNRLVGAVINNIEYHYIRNLQGDIIALINNAGTEVVSYTYDPWGKLISIKDYLGRDVTNDTTHVGYKNPYRYRGYRFDNETNLYYLQSRYYSSEWGRFINADAIVGQVGELLGHNLFTYCKNNAVNRRDPSGFKVIFEDEETQREYDDWLWEQRLTSTPTSYSKNNLRNVAQGAKKTLVEASPGLAVGTLYSIGETFGDYITIGKSITKITGAVKISPITLGAFEQLFKKLGLIGLGASLYDNMNYGIGIGLTRSVIDIAGVFITSALIGAFAASGGLAAIGIGLTVGATVEVVKWAVTTGVKEFD